MSNAEATKSKEELTREPRFLVFGTMTAGSQKIAEALRKAAKDIPDSKIDVVQNVRGIEDMFYDRFEDPLIVTHHKASMSKHAGEAALDQKFTTTGWTRIPVRKQGPDTLPKAVVVLPEMRQRGFQGEGMTIPTPFDRIQELCEQNGVPMMRVEAQPSAEQITQLASELIVK